MTVPCYSVIMPAKDAASVLPATLGALRRAATPPGDYELIVVDDGSKDNTASVASQFADQVIQLAGPSRGPAGARNAGAERARGEWLVFVDADVRVHRATLQRFGEARVRHPGANAIFGTYDATPAASGLVSTYRNLLHRLVHLRGAGAADTFWAGLGMVRRDRFAAVGGFDAERYRGPEIEDVELGYRLRDAGDSIVLDPTIEGTHLKRWTLGRRVWTDVFSRAIPWMHLLLDRGSTPAGLSVNRAEQVKVGLAGMVLLLIATAAVGRDPRFAGLALVALLGLVMANLAVYRWFGSQRGWGFAVATVPLHLGYYLTNALAAGWVVLSRILSGRWRRKGPGPVPGAR